MATRNFPRAGSGPDTDTGPDTAPGGAGHRSRPGTGYSREPEAAGFDDPRRPDRPTHYKGRGTGVVIAHRYDKIRRTAPEAAEGLVRQASAQGDAEEADQAPAVDADGPGPGTEIRFERARRIIATNDSPDVPFEQSINPYRGCEHGCIYCFARPTHAYLDLSPGLDFERIIIAKENAAERFRAQLGRPGYRCRTITLGAATDPYQPVERRLGITRQLISVAVAHRHPFFVVTKNALVERDIDLIAPMAAERLAGVMITLTTLDPALARILEPRASAPHRRLRAIEALASAGIPVALSVGPVIPFINEPDIERIIAAAAAAGARTVHYTVIRLPWEVEASSSGTISRSFAGNVARNSSSFSFIDLL